MAILDDQYVTITPSEPDQASHDQAIAADAIGTIEDPNVQRIPREFAQALIREVVDKYAYVCSREDKQRAREDEDLRFDRALLEDQWPDDIRAIRGGRIGSDGKLVDARPMLVIPKLDQPIQQVIQEGRRARLAINVKPKGAKASLKGAELRQGMIRAIEADCGAQNGRMWAFDRAVKVGRGYYRVILRYNNDDDDQLDLATVRVKNQSSVFLDPDAVEPDFSDMSFAISCVDLTHDAYKARYGRAARIDADFPGPDDQRGTWLGEKTIKVAEYWRVRWQEVKGSTRKRPVVHRWVVSGNDILESTPWLGRFIPFIVVIGRECNVNGDVCYKGLISNAKDAARGYNYMRSAAVEMVGQAPKAPYLVDKDQIEGYEGDWAELNVRNLPYLLYNRYSKDKTRDLGTPQRNFGDPAIEATTLEVMAFDRDLMAITGRWEPSRGQLSGERSGKAIQALQQQGETSTSGFLENFASYSLPYEGRIYLDLLRHIYREPGRIIRLLGDKPQDERYVMLEQPFVPNGPNGLPQPYAPPPPPMRDRLMMRVGLMQPPPVPPEVQQYSLNDGGDYMCTVTVGRAYATEREATAAAIEAIMKAAPQLVPVLVDLWVENIDSPTSQQIVERLRKMNPGLLSGEAPIPPEIQAQMQALQQQLGEMQGALQAAQQELRSKQAELDAKMVLQDAELASRERIAGLQAETELLKTRATIAGKETLALLEARIRELEEQNALGRDMVRTSVDQEHEREMSNEGHERAMARDRAVNVGKAALSEAADLRARRFDGLDPQSPLGPLPADDPRE